MTGLKCFALLVPTVLVGLAVGVWLCIVLDLAVATAPAWAALGGTVLVAVAAGAIMLDRIILAPSLLATQSAATAEAAAAVRLESHRRLRHDIRGALSPALLTADRLLTNADPAVQRAGDIVVRAVERAAALLTDPEPTPPDPS